MDRPGPFNDPSTLAYARKLLTAYPRRDELLPEIAFGDFTWVMLVDLYVALENGVTLSLSDLYASGKVPKATVLRSISRLVESGHLVTVQDARDGRRTLVRLSDDLHRRLHIVLMQERMNLWDENDKSRG